MQGWKPCSTWNPLIPQKAKSRTGRSGLFCFLTFRDRLVSEVPADLVGHRLHHERQAFQFLLQHGHRAA